MGCSGGRGEEAGVAAEGATLATLGKGDECIPPPLPPPSPKASVLLQRMHLHFSDLFLKSSLPSSQSF